MFEKNKYYRWYIGITSVDDDADGYSEKHHRIPRAMGGSNVRENLVRLSFRKHFLAHWLLTKCATGSDRLKMLKALSFMIADRKGICSSWQYAVVKKAAKDAQRGRPSPFRGRKHSPENAAKARAARLGLKHSEQAKAKISLGLMGRVLSDESIKKLSVSHTGKQLTSEHRKKLSIAAKRREFSESDRARISAGLLGNKNTLGHRHTDETRLKMSKAGLGNKNRLGTITSPETRAKQSAAHRARLERLAVAAAEGPEK